MVGNMGTNPDLLAEAVFDIAATKGLDAASIREVAAAAGVSIGAVQYHFATKDELYAFAFSQVIRRVEERLAKVDLEAGLEDRLVAVLSELLPMDPAREREARVMLGFAARATSHSLLAATQRSTLDGIVAQLTEQLDAAGVDDAATRAVLLLAAVDGLTLDGLSSGDLDPDLMLRALRAQVRLVLR